MTGRDYLAKHHIQCTQERLLVVDYLMQYHTHPTADQVFQGLMNRGSDISRATVFNTLNTLSDRCAVTALLFEDGVTRYDIELHPHAHFRCSRCGKIVNIPLKRNASFDLPEGYRPCHRDYYIVGCCPDCCPKSERNS